MKNRRILITSGPTSVAIDEMRVITNRSTGEMGRLLANACAKRGADVTFLEGAVTTGIPLDKRVRVRKFFFFDEIEALFRTELRRRPDIVVHAAAVSDFKPQKSFKGKVASSDKLALELVPTAKLIRNVKKIAPRTFLVGFKFEPSLPAAVEGAEALIGNSGCELVVANAQEKGKYRAVLVEKGLVLRKPFVSKAEVVGHLVDLFRSLCRNAGSLRI